jgi:arylsulfatase
MAMALTASCAGPPDRPPDIVLITIDTLRADRLGCYGYYRDTSPHLDRFAAEAVLFERTFSHAGSTLPSHASLMTSTHPARHRQYGNDTPFDPDRVGLRTLAQMLEAAGYRTAAFVSAAVLKRASGMDTGFAVFGQPETAECRAAETTDRALAYLDGTADDRPLFLWVHYFDPHDPYEPPGEFLRMFPLDQAQLVYLEANEFTHWDHPGIRSANAGYDGEVRYVDQEVGRLLDGLRARGIWDDAAVTVTADHGDGLGQHDWLVHGRIHNEILGVPLLMKLPRASGVAPGRRSGLAALVDVVPTLVEELALPVGPDTAAQFEGRNLLRGPARESVFSERTRTRPDRVGSGEKSALQSRRWKLTLASEEGEELFDLEEDAFELRNVAGEHPEVAEEMRADILSRLGATADPETAPGEFTAERMEELRALGYVE